jgi:scramblase
MNILLLANLFWIPLLKPSKFGIYGGVDTTFFSGRVLAYVPSRIKAANRVTPEPILSKVSEPQPEPGLDRFAQFAKIDEGFYAWHFTLRGSRGEELASISREFRGFGREIFTDTGKIPRLMRVRSGSLIMCRTILG